VFSRANGRHQIIEQIFAAFKPDVPTHILVGTIKSLSVDLFIHLAEQRIGIKPRVVESAKLRLMKDDHFRAGLALYCMPDAEKGSSSHPKLEDEESLEKIQQIVL
jgi:hypothetical protein